MTPFLAATRPLLPRPFPPCPSCRSTAEPLPLVYGYPDLELGMAAERGEIVLGGCLVGEESPEFECRDCHALLPWTAGRTR